MRTITKEQREAMTAGRKQQLEARERPTGKATMSPMERATAEPKSMRKAINAMCWKCEGGDADPHVGWRIGNCCCEKTCPLYPLRPHQNRFGAAAPATLGITTEEGT